MRKKLSKLLVVFAFFATVAIGNLSPLTASAAADTCTWTGATNANWNNSGNWTGCDNGGLPENGDTLAFPSSASNKTMNNDFVSFQASNLVFNGSGYTLNGAGFNVTSSITASESATINTNMAVGTGSTGHFTYYPLSGKTLTLTGTTNFNLTSFYEVNIGSSSFTGTVDFAGNLVGSSAAQFIVVDGATAIVRGSSNTFTANQVGAESAGVFDCRSATCFGDNANDIYVGNGRVAINVSNTFSNDFVTSSSSAGNSEIEATQNVSITGAGTVNDELITYQSAASSNLQFTGAITLNQNLIGATNHMSAQVIFDGAISGPGDITAYQGNTVLSAASNFSGDVIVKDGATVTADQINSLGTTAGATIVEDGGSLVVDAAIGAVSIAEPLQIAGEGVSPTTYKGAVYLTSGNNNFTLTGTVALTGDAKIYNESAADSLIIEGAISGPHDLEYHAVDGAYIQVGDSGAAANTYTGTTTVTGGVVYLEKALAIPGDLIIDADDPVNNEVTVYTYAPNAIADSGTVMLNNEEDGLRIGNQGTTEVIGGLTGAAGQVSFQYSDSDLTVDQDFDSTFGGKFYADGESPTFTKKGTGNLLLTGGMQWNLDDDVNFVVEEGTLTVNGDLSTADGTNMQVKDTGKLKGNGTVGKLSTNGGTIAPGTSPGKLNVASLTLDSTNTVEFELDGPVAGTSYDQIASSGAVNLAGATLSLKPSYTPAAGEEFTIITGAYVTGTFKNLPDNSTLIADGITFRVNYGEASVTLTYISGTYNPNANDSLINTGTGMLLAGIASLMLIAAATVLTTRRQRQPIA